MTTKLRDTYDWIFRDAERPLTQAELFRRVCYALNISTFISTGQSLETDSSQIVDTGRRYAFEQLSDNLRASEVAEGEGDSDKAANCLRTAIKLFQEFAVIDPNCSYRPFTIPAFAETQSAS